MYRALNIGMSILRVLYHPKEPLDVFVERDGVDSQVLCLPHSNFCVTILHCDKSGYTMRVMVLSSIVKHSLMALLLLIRLVCWDKFLGVEISSGGAPAFR